MGTRVDKYPSRVDGEAGVVPRVDPVVYGTEDGPLSRGMLDEFERNGFLVMRDLLDSAEIAVLRDECERLRRSERIRQSELAITEPTSGETRSIFAVQTVSEIFAKLVCHEMVVRAVRQLLGGDVYLHQSRANLKPGFRGKEFYWHSDFETWHAEDGMPSMRAVSCSIALTDNYEFNGPLMLIPGSHRQFIQCMGRTPDDHYLKSLKKQEYGVPSDAQLERLINEAGIAAPMLHAGSMIIFDCNTMHGSNSNITPYPRTNVFAVYNSVENMLVEPFAAKKPRPWFLGNREPTVIEPSGFSLLRKQSCAQPA
ncbi:MAG: ectoine hydroxylase [Candidatus Hydrogenedentes bacterium]|nr:ectoine hydroxylase [Candidatus Hydrogenedentota bacterium]